MFTLMGWLTNAMAASSSGHHVQAFLGQFSQKRLYLNRGNAWQSQSRFCAWRFPDNPNQRYYYTQITCAAGSEGNCSNNYQFQLKPVTGNGQAIPADVYYKPSAKASWQKVEYHRMIPNDQSQSRSCSHAWNQKSIKVEIPLNAIDRQAIKPGRYHLGLSVQMRPWENPSDIIQNKRVDVFMNVREQIKISGMKDINFRWTPGQNQAIKSDNRHCVFVRGGGLYRVAIDSQNDSTRFYLSGSGEKIPYQLGYKNGNRRAEWINRPGQLNRLFQGSHIQDCSGHGFNANLIFKSNIPSKTLSGNYSDRITITVQAQ